MSNYMDPDAEETRGHYGTLSDAIQREIVEPIEAGGTVEDARAEYDVDAIADALIEWVDAYDVDRDAYWLPHQGFRVRSEYAEDSAKFWALVEQKSTTR